jgi:hypothetical protein
MVLPKIARARGCEAMTTALAVSQRFGRQGGSHRSLLRVSRVRVALATIRYNFGCICENSQKQKTNVRSG